MVYQYLALICLFCGLIGYALGTLETNAWNLLLYTAGAIVSLQVVYVVTLVLKA